MTTIICWRDDCKYQKTGSECDLGCISINEDGECECFRDYHDDVEWKKAFWKRMLDRERNLECRVRYLGKELEFGGRIFYVENRSYYAHLTDKETGLLCGSIAELNENADIVGKIKEKAKDYSPVTDLPIAVHDEKNRKYIYPKEESEDTE